MFFSDINSDGFYECLVTSFSNGSGIFYYDGEKAEFFSGDFGGTSTFSVDFEKSLICESYLFGSYNGAAYFLFDGKTIEEKASYYYDELEDKYYLNGIESTKIQIDEFIDSIGDFKEMSGDSDYNSAPVVR